MASTHRSIYPIHQRIRLQQHLKSLRNPVILTTLNNNGKITRKLLERTSVPPQPTQRPKTENKNTQDIYDQQENKTEETTKIIDETNDKREEPAAKTVVNRMQIWINLKLRASISPIVAVIPFNDYDKAMAQHYTYLVQGGLAFQPYEKLHSVNVTVDNAWSPKSHSYRHDFRRVQSIRHTNTQPALRRSQRISTVVPRHDSDRRHSG